MPHSYVNCLVHCVFSTKGRRATITPELRDRLWAFLGGIAREHRLAALAIGGTENHVHLLLDVPATITLAKAVQHLKGGSSKWVHDAFPACRQFAWQEGYGAFSIGVSGVAATRRYIETQTTHHARRSFEEEWIAILKKHGISYDERYAFG